MTTTPGDPGLVSGDPAGTWGDPMAAPAASPAELVARQQQLDRLLAAEGAGHVVHDLPVRADGRVVALESRPWRVDPIPYVVGEADFAYLSAAIADRVRGCEAVLADLYGERRLVTERVIDPAGLWSTHRYRLAALSAPSPERWLTVYAVDVVRDVDGVWHAVAEYADAPAGFGYALLARVVFNQMQQPRVGPGPRSVEPFLGVLRHALASISPVDGPRIVVFSGGIDHPSYIEHSYLATRLGFNLVESPDLVVRQRRLFLRTLSGLEPIDVLFRRLEDDRLDPMEVNATGAAGIPGVLMAAGAGSLVLANAHGAGVLEAGLFASSRDRAFEMLTGTLPSLALRPPAEADGSGVDAVLGRPAERVPRVVDGRIVETPIVLRFHAIVGPDGITVVPAANGRVIAPTDDPRIPTPCVAKDVWVLGPDAPIVAVARAAPQVDLIASVPTRAADSLYWLGRAAERAEVVARAARVTLGEVGFGHPRAPDAAVLAALCAADPGLGTIELLDAARNRIVREIGVVLAEAASVREFLSSTAGRVLGVLADVRSRLNTGPVDALAVDDVMLNLSALSGLWSESVVRGPAWHFGDFARRYERVVAVLESLAVIWPAAPDRRPDADEASRFEALLATHDSLVAYRRRYRSDVEWPAIVGLLLVDRRNPRSAGATMDALVRAAEAIGWDEGVPGLIEVRDGLGDIADGAAAFVAISRLHEIAGRLTAERLAAPPDPRLVHLRYGPAGGGAQGA